MNAFFLYIRKRPILGMLVLCLGLSAALPAHAATQTASPSSCVNGSSGDVAWVNPGRAVASDDSHATVSLNDGDQSNYLQCTNYGFSIPAGATINGITVNIERHSTATNTADRRVRIVKGGTRGDSNFASGTGYPDTDTVAVYGGPTQLWGETWTVADINSANFGAALSARKTNDTGSARTVSVDHIQIVVTYTLAAPAAPTVTTSSATSPTATGATLNGIVSSNNSAVTAVNFEYGPTVGYGTSVGATPGTLVSGATNTAVSAVVSSLSCGTTGTTYNFRAYATNGVGTGYGGNQTFTVPCPPTVTTGAATSAGATTATLNGTVSSNGGTTSTYFEYGTSTSYGTEVAASPSSLNASATGSAITKSLSGLACGTTYHFRARATNPAGTAYGDDATFSTASCPVTMTKTASTTAASVGNYVMYYITLTNPNASDMSNVTVTDVLQGGLSYQNSYADTGYVGVSGQTVTWTIPTLAAGKTANLTLVVIPTQKGTYSNSASSGSVTATAAMVVISGAWVQYRMDEPAESWNGTAGEVTDSGTKLLNGTLVHPVSSTQTDPVTPTGTDTIKSQYPSVTGGGFCNAAKFDGKTVLKMPRSDFFQFTTNVSATAWIWPEAYPSSDLYSILSNDTNYEFHINSDGKLYWWWQWDTLTSTQKISKTGWTHVAITMDTTSAAKIYINGVEDVSKTLSGGTTLNSNACDFYVGGDVYTDGNCTFSTSRLFRGLIDEAKVYDFTLSAAEVKADMTQGRVCSGTYFDHIQMESTGTASTCGGGPVILKACIDAQCSSLYPGTVTVNLTPSTIWATNPVTFTGGLGIAYINSTKLSGPGNITIGTDTVVPQPTNASTCKPAGCVISVFQAPSCLFDAVEVGANPRTNLFTKLVATSFDADILALTGGVSVNADFRGTAMVDLVDASSSVCPTGAGLTTPQAVTFLPTGVSSSGRSKATLAYSGAARDVRVRMVGGTPNPDGSIPYACSYDNFAIRPTTVTLTTPSQTMAVAPSATDTNTLKAGAAFTLRATADTGYDGTLTQDTAKLTAQDPTKNVRANGGKVGQLLPATLIGNETAVDNASYAEVGYLYLGANAYADSTFTTVDRAVGDCVTNTTNDANFSNSLSGGKYGCDIGTAAIDFGRFIPDHFITAAVGTMACPAGLTCPAGSGSAYSGQPLASTPTRVPLKLIAASAGGGTTQNYAGYFAKDATLAVFDSAGSVETTAVSKGSLTNTSVLATAFTETRDASNVVTKTGGVAWASPTYTFTNWPTAPTDVYFRATAAEGVSSLRSPAASSEEGGVKIVTGRLKMSNATGSEKRPLSVPIQAQYWSDKTWVPNGADNTPVFSADAVFKSPASVPSIAALTTASIAQKMNGAVPVPGQWILTLSEPNAVGRVDLVIDLGTTAQEASCLALDPRGTVVTPAAVPWLRGTCTGGAAAAADPSARATFGVYTPENRRQVHVRELY